MDYEKWVLERYRSALREYEIAQNHFSCCEPDFIDSAIDDLVHAEKALGRVLKELKHGMGTELLNNQE